MSALDHYLAAKWRLVPIPAGKKGPVDRDWPGRTYSRDKLLASANVGVILGPASGDLVDVDLDCDEAITLAPTILPRTLTSGRASKPRSHRWYRSHGIKLRQFRAPRSDGGSMLAELRGQGGQTVVPPSHHPSGEPIEWCEDDGRDCVDLPDAAVMIDAAELHRRVARLACASLVMRTSGEIAARSLLRDCRWPRLPDGALARCREWLGITPDRAPTMRSRPPGGDVMARARAYLERVSPAISGQGGHATTFLAAQHLVRGFGLDDESALSVLAEWNARCVPPWTDKELRHKVRQARERGQTVPDGAHVGGGQR